MAAVVSRYNVAGRFGKGAKVGEPWWKTQTALRPHAMADVDLRDMFVCIKCSAPLTWRDDRVACDNCGASVERTKGIPRFVQDDLNESFAIQWDRFWDVQLDTRNGTTQSRDRLLEQSKMTPEDFRERTVLEVGCGAGRFTEVLLAMGARVVSFDYSGAVDVNARGQEKAIVDGTLLCAQGDVFSLPVRQRAFDIVLCYGVIQHTANASAALLALWEHVAPGGRLLVDRYQLDLRHVLPFKYALRPITRRLSPHFLLNLVEAYCRVAVPIQRRLLTRLAGDGVRRWARLAVNRSPNSVYPLNLAVQGKLDDATAFRWSVLDTYDQYAPAYDSPCTARTWRRDVESLKEGRVVHVASGGQGNVAVVERTA